MEKNNKYDYYKATVIISSIITMILAALTKKTNGYEYMYFIPAVYLLLFLFSNSLHFYSKRYNGLLILNVFMYIRYVIATLIVAINKDFNTPVFYEIEVLPSSNSFAIFLILIEMISIFLIIAFFSKKFYEKKYGKKEDEKQEVKEKCCNIKFEKKHMGIVLTLFTILSLFIFLIYPNSFFPKSIIVFKGDFIPNENAIDSIKVIANAFKTIIMVILINNFICEFQDKKKIKYVIYSYLIILIYILLNTSTSRLTMVLPIMLFVLVTNKIFEGKGKLLLILVITILITSISSITLYKSSWRFDSNATIFEIFTTAIGDIQEYTSYIRPVAIGIETTEKFDKEISMKTFLNDIFGSIPIVSHCINQKDRINIYYNTYALNLKNTSQIIPMLITSSAYFSKLFCWLFTDVFVVLLMFFDSRKTKNNFMSKYMSLYLSFVFAFVLFSNVQTLVGNIFVNYLPVVCLMYLDNKIVMNNIKKGVKLDEDV